MKIKSTLVITLILIIQSNINSYALEQSPSLKDIKDHWAYESISKFYNNGYIKGYENQNFKPDNNMSRAEFVTTFNNYFGLTNKTGKVFSDTLNHWAKDAIDIAFSNGVCQGTSKTTFEPDKPITREEMCVMIANYLNISDKNHDKLNKFTDKSSEWAKDSIEAILESGIMHGYEDNSFRPKNYSTRAEVVNSLNQVNKNDFEISTDKVDTVLTTSEDKTSTVDTDKVDTVLATSKDKNDIVNQKNVDYVVDLINNLKTSITYGDIYKLNSQINTIENKYRLLNEKEKTLVNNYNKIDMVKKEIKNIQNEMFPVFTAIADIPSTITKDNLEYAKKAVNKAESLYNDLSLKNKKHVTPSELSIIEISKFQINNLEN